MSTKPPRIYLSGPITGQPDRNRPAFDAEAARLRALGYEVFNPHENGVPPDAPWEKHMKVDLILLVVCDAVVMLPGWHRSRGANLEVHVAAQLGIPRYAADLFPARVQP